MDCGKTLQEKDNTAQVGEVEALRLPQVCGGQPCLRDVPSVSGKISLPSFLSIMDTEL